MNLLRKKIFSACMLLVVIFSIAFFLRFYKLGVNPPSLTWDEVAWGYNAYSIGIDGKDEFGRFLPHDYLESFGDFKPPVYAYLDVIPVKLFGITEFAVRFPSAFLGFLTVVITYFLVRKLLPNSKGVAILSTFLLAISPWHINLSRAAFEANVSTFFIVSGVWLFLKGLTEKKWLLLSVVSFVLSLYTFNSARVFVPLFVTFLFLAQYKEIIKNKKIVSFAFLVGVILLLPILPFLFSPQAALRFREVNIFSDIGIVKKANTEINNDKNVWWSKLIHNRRYEYTLEFLHHYFDNLSPDFLFIKGDGNPKFSTRDVGELYIWEFLSLSIGFLYLFKKKEGKWWIIPVWIILGIVPAGTARETPHALRIETIIPTLQIVSAYGLFQMYGRIKRRRFYFPALVFIGVVVLFNFLYYVHGYYAHYSREFSGEWQYGYKESVVFANSVKDQFDEIRITDRLGRPYVYYLFYTKTNPDYFRKTAVVKREALGFVKVERFGKFYFSENITSPKHGKILYINVPGLVPTDAHILKTFYLLNNNPALVAYTK